MSITYGTSSRDPFYYSGLSGLPETLTGLKTGLVFKMNIDILDGETEMIVMAELPGVAKENFEVTLENNLLSIKAKKDVPENLLPESLNYRISEITFGEDRRRIRMPLNIDQDSAKTCFKDGMLCIKFQKLPAHPAKRLEIAYKLVSGRNDL